jgi:hypothetical protein
MRFTELLRDMAENVECHDCDSISSVLRTSADIIEESGLYKMRWAALSEEISKLKKENESLTMELHSQKIRKDT